MENLGIDAKLLIAQLINFALFFYIFKRFIAKPFIKYIEIEKKKEEDREKGLNEVQKEKEKVGEQLNAKMQAIKKDEVKIIDEAKIMAEKLKEKILLEANNEAEEIRGRARKLVESERKDLQSKTQEKILELSLFIINNAVRDVLTEDSKKKITERLIRSSRSKSLEYEN